MRVLRHACAVAFMAVPVVGSPGDARSASRLLECTAPKDALRLKVGLPNTARAIRRGDELIVVAIGSSSTEGVGASSAGNTYPARFARELVRRWPRLHLRVLNEGIGGETASEMLARFETDVLAHKPHLVIWQSGSNSLLRGRSLKAYLTTVRTGILRLKAADVDVILMDPQFAPAVIAQPAYQRFITAIRSLANDLKVGLFQRFAVMRHWISNGKTRVADVISGDHLHMNDASYACIARLLADSVSSAAREELGPAPASASIGQIFP